MMITAIILFCTAVALVPSMPDADNPWTIQILSLTGLDDIYENTERLNLILEREEFPQTGAYPRFFIAQGVFQNKRVYRVCAGAFDGTEESKETVYRLRARGVPCFSRRLVGGEVETWENISISEGRIVFGSGHFVELFEPGDISWQKERAYLSSDSAYAALTYSNGTGYEGEGENLIILNLKNSYENIALIDQRMVFPVMWFQNEAGSVLLVVELISGGTAYSNEVIVINCEGAVVVERYRHCTINNCVPSALILNVMSVEETILGEIEINLLDLENK